MLTTQLRRMSGGRILSLALLGGMALTTGVVNASPLPQSQAQDAPRYTWANFDGQWFCRSWSDTAPSVKVITPAQSASTASPVVWDYDRAAGRAFSLTGAAGQTSATTTKCTTRWRVDGSMRLVSNDSAWAPNPTGAWPTASDLLAFTQSAHQVTPRMRALTPVVKHKAVVKVTHTAPSAPRGTTGGSTGGSSTGGSSGGSGGYNPWAPVPGHPTYRMGDFAGDPYASSFGVCTWYAWYRHRSEPLASFGSAINWVSAARAHGLSVGYTPAVGATVVFSPGVEGAGGGGHAAHVEAVLGGGWFMISEMNFYWNGGGWGKVDYRYVYVRSGVTFIY
ncbi:MAG TPA: CHAP domain-containing protein [Ktedonobacterales bacterium]|nr:CHAP domain-containing protein [Ktedonobacterales bacterium]